MVLVGGRGERSLARPRSHEPLYLGFWSAAVPAEPLRGAERRKWKQWPSVGTVFTVIEQRCCPLPRS